MKCEKLHKKLIFFLDGDLPEKEAQEINSHLNECTDCDAFAEDMKKTLGIIQEENRRR